MDYIVTIGLEVHVEIHTQSKMFCSCANRFGDPPNTHVCPVCLGYPGALPVPNQEAIQKTILAGLMINAEIPQYSKFDRKAYWYPDMAKNYQITQYDQPLCRNGKILIEGKSLQGEVGPKWIRINRIHLEEDVAKSIHFPINSGIDFNRSGVPLMEIVSEPDLASADEAYAYLQALKEIMEYGEISTCNMEKGQMRCDVNISVRPINQTAFNPKTEIKNLNSLKAVHRAITYEVHRQIELLEDHLPLQQQTRGWDDNRGETYLLRQKEDAEDYRYFPDPDLMPFHITPTMLESIRQKMPELPEQKRHRFIQQYEIPQYDAQVLCSEKAIADWFEESIRCGVPPKTASNWIMGDLLRELTENNISIREAKLTPSMFAEMIQLIQDGTINGRIAKTIFSEMFKTGKTAKEIVKEKGLIQVVDHDLIRSYVIQVLDQNPGAYQDYLQGQSKVLGFFVGQVMKLSQGKANPQLVQQLLRDELQRRKMINQ